MVIPTIQFHTAYIMLYVPWYYWVKGVFGVFVLKPVFCDLRHVLAHTYLLKIGHTYRLIVHTKIIKRGSL